MSLKDRRGRQGYSREELERLAEHLQELGGNGHPNKLQLLFEAKGGVNKSVIRDNCKLRTDHVGKLKKGGFLMETQAEYRLTPLGRDSINHVEQIHNTLSQMSIDTRKDLLMFLKFSGYDEDLTSNWELFTDSMIISQEPMSKYSTLVRTMADLREITLTINVVDEYRYRIQEAADLDPERVELVHTPRTCKNVLGSDDLFALAKEHERHGVTSRFLPSEAPKPGYNLGLMQIDEELVSDVRGATGWLERLDLSDWLVVIEAKSSRTQECCLLISDSDAVRDWACGDDGIYRKYKTLSDFGSWVDGEGVVGEHLLNE